MSHEQHKIKKRHTFCQDNKIGKQLTLSHGCVSSGLDSHKESKTDLSSTFLHGVEVNSHAFLSKETVLVTYGVHNHHAHSVYHGHGLGHDLLKRVGSFVICFKRTPKSLQTSFTISFKSLAFTMIHVAFQAKIVPWSGSSWALPPRLQKTENQSILTKTQWRQFQVHQRKRTEYVQETKIGIRPGAFLSK